MKKPTPRPAANQKDKLEAAAEAFSESFDKMIKDRLAPLSPEERRAWLNRLWRRILGPAGLSLGLYRNDDQKAPVKRPKKDSAKPARRTKALRRTGPGRNRPLPGSR